jgi:hypothetical protein
MALSGNLNALADLARQLDALGEALPRAAQKVAEEIPALLQAEFSGGTDPYGSPWKPLAPATIAKGRSAPPLTDTGAMRASARAMAISRSGVAIHLDAPAGYHQPTRPIVPVDDRLPSTWEDLVKGVKGAIEAELAKVKR